MRNCRQPPQPSVIAPRSLSFHTSAGGCEPKAEMRSSMVGGAASRSRRAPVRGSGTCAVDCGSARSTDCTP